MDRTDSRLAPSPEPASDDAPSPFDSPVPDRRDLLDFEPVPLRYRTGGLTPQKQREYVEALADTGICREAAARIGLSEQAINRVRRRSDARDFDRACEAAHLFGARRLRSIAFERAIEGTLKGHYYHGELVGQERVFDNRLLIYLLGRTGHFLEPPGETEAVCDNWQEHMEALEQGLPPPDPGCSQLEEDEAGDACGPGEDPRACCDEDGIWWTCFPPPEHYVGKEHGELGDPFYKRTMTAEEEAAALAQEAANDEAEIARWCGIRDRYFGLPPRGSAGFSIPREAETSEPSETSDEPCPAESPVEYKSLITAPAVGQADPRHPGEGGETARPARHSGEGRKSMNTESRNLGPPRSWIPASAGMTPGRPCAPDDDSPPPTSKRPPPGILGDEPPGAVE